VPWGLLSDCCRGLELNRKLHSWKKQLPKRILLEGATDPPQRKLTNNSHDLKGSTSQSDVELGVFCCAIGGLPLFASLDVMPTRVVWMAFLFASSSQRSHCTRGAKLESSRSENRSTLCKEYMSFRPLL
jgi:peptide methionine sulfoxide reductase MsrB